MIKRAFILFLLIHTISVFTVFSLTHQLIQIPVLASSGAGEAGQMQLSHPDDTGNPVLHFLQSFFSDTEQKESNQKGNNLSDFFRIRSYLFRFYSLPLLGTHLLVWVVAALVLLEKPADHCYRDGTVPLPKYYQHLFRLTPF